MWCALRQRIMRRTRGGPQAIQQPVFNHPFEDVYCSTSSSAAPRDFLNTPYPTMPSSRRMPIQKMGFPKIDPSSFFGSSPMVEVVGAGCGVDLDLEAGVMLAAASFAVSSAFAAATAFSLASATLGCKRLMYSFCAQAEV